MVSKIKTEEEIDTLTIKLVSRQKMAKAKKKFKETGMGYLEFLFNLSVFLWHYLNLGLFFLTFVVKSLGAKSPTDRLT